MYDDPEFGAEPILRAGEVTAALRLTSLLRGRMEIARLDLTEPSLNLVHNPSGRWNLEALLERSSQIPLAPTGKPKLEPRPGFPYIEVSSGRVNFKSGAEKRPYALTNADFSLWQDSENTWGIRLKAQPVRTDLNLSDTGILQINGSWQRAQTFRETPLQLSVEWSRAQLGQFTKLFTGNDKGWRGTIQWDAEMSGSPANLKIGSSASIDDFRRYDITSGKAMRLAAHCDGKYSSVTHDFHEVLCSAPVGSGLMTLTGDMGLPGSHQFALMARAVNIPASAALVLAERAKKNLPDDLEADGAVHWDISMQENAALGEPLRLSGGGEISDLRLTSAANKANIAWEAVPFSLAGGESEQREPARAVRTKSPAMRLPQGGRIEVGPVGFGTGRANTATLRGWINRGGYKVALDGEVEIARALRLGRIIGLPVWSSSPEGSAQVDLQVAGIWSGLSKGTSSGFLGPQITGTVRLRNAEMAPHGFGGPIEITSAEMLLLPDQVRVSKLNAKAAGAVWTGSLSTPRGCGLACPVRVAVNANHVVLSQVGEWLSPTSKKRPWYRVLESSAPSGPSLVTALRLSGRLSADQLVVHGIAARRVAAQISLESGTLRISDLTADVLGGKSQGEWTVDFSGKPAACKGSGKLSEVSLDGLANAMSDSWIAGTANASYAMSGKCFAEFWPSAEGTLRVEMRDGLFPHVTIGEDTAPLGVTQLTGQINIRAAKIEIKDAKLDAPDGKFTLSGTASFKRELDFKLTPAIGAKPSYEITGTLAEPQVALVPGPEQARLKPISTKLLSTERTPARATPCPPARSSTCRPQ